MKNNKTLPPERLDDFLNKNIKITFIDNTRGSGVLNFVKTNIRGGVYMLENVKTHKKIEFCKSWIFEIKEK